MLRVGYSLYSAKMFNLGVDGDDAVVEQHAVAQQMARYQDPMMQDDEEPSPRGEEHTPMISFLTTKLLRLSFSLKALSMALMSLFFLGFGGRWVFTFHSHPDMSNGFHLSMAVLMLIQLAGTLGLCLFQCFIADDSKCVLEIIKEQHIIFSLFLILPFSHSQGDKHIFYTKRVPSGVLYI